MPFSVLMSVYANERAAYFAQCLESLLAQTLQPAEVVIVEDGPISAELAATLAAYRHRLPIKSVPLPVNIGLAGALNAGLAACSHELVARMDTDDVALPQRFARQFEFMQTHPEVSVSGAWVLEKDQDMRETLFEKKLPTEHAAIAAFTKRRNPIAHPVVIFRKSAVLPLGGYPLVFPEDYALWSLMLVKGFRFANIPEVLLHMRTGDDFIGRRGLGFLKREFSLVKFQLDIGFVSRSEALLFVASRIVLRISPPFVRKLLYKFTR